MPTYEYKCSACGHAFELFQSITAEPVKRCPQCGKAKVKRLIGTGAGLIFKGSGFYITDYRDSGYKEKAKAESGASGDGQKSETGKSGGGEGGAASTTPAADGEAKPAAAKPESKPAPKSESKPTKKKSS